MYMELNKSWNLSESEKKVKFLFSHVPSFRRMKRNIIEDLEQNFILEEYTPGYVILS